MKTKTQIINETVDYYSADPKGRRAFVDVGGVSSCRYCTTDGRRCAVGRCLLPDFPTKDIEGKSASSIVNLETILQPEYRGHEPSFWDELQDLHDYAGNWDENGLSREGSKVVREKLWWPT